MTEAASHAASTIRATADAETTTPAETAEKHASWALAAFFETLAKLDSTVRRATMRNAVRTLSEPQRKELATALDPLHGSNFRW